MTAAQRAALEALAGRELTAAEDSHAALRNDGLLAESLSVGRTRVASTRVDFTNVLAALAPHGGEFLDALALVGASNAQVKWAFEALRAGTFDVGSPQARVELPALAAAVPTLAGPLQTLLAMAVVSSPVGPGAVSAILNGA